MVTEKRATSKHTTSQLDWEKDSRGKKLMDEIIRAVFV